MFLNCINWPAVVLAAASARPNLLVPISIILASFSAGDNDSSMTIPHFLRIRVLPGAALPRAAKAEDKSMLYAAARPIVAY